MPTEQPTQAPLPIERPGRDAAHTRGRIVRLLLAWVVIAAGLIVLRGFLQDPFWRGLFLPTAFVLVLIAGVFTVRAARLRGGSAADERRREERRLRDRRSG